MNLKKSATSHLRAEFQFHSSIDPGTLCFDHTSVMEHIFYKSLHVSHFRFILNYASCIGVPVLPFQQLLTEEMSVNFNFFGVNLLLL